MNKKLLELIEKYFIESLQTKTGWGRNEVIALYKEATNKALLEVIDNAVT